MKKSCLFFLLAVLSNQALGFSFRNKRQAESDDWSTNDNLEDRYGWNWIRLPGGQLQIQFPDQEQRPGQGNSQTTTPSANANGSTTQSSSVRACIRTCPVTSEYNPVCGSNGVTYPNPGHLGCAQACGVTVTLVRQSRCPVKIELQ